MPRPKTIPRYAKHPQSGRAPVTINGRDYLLGLHGTNASKREYDRIFPWTDDRTGYRAGSTGR